MSKRTFKDLLKQNRAWYKKIGFVDCAILNQKIVFNSKGFYHLRYGGCGKARRVKEQHYKLGLLPLVIPVIQKATCVYEYKPDLYSKKIGKYFEIWELREVVGKQKVSVSVVLRRIGKGNITFYSVWKNAKYRVSKIKKAT